jgi:hypothetical protein
VLGILSVSQRLRKLDAPERSLVRGCSGSTLADRILYDHRVPFVRAGRLGIGPRSIGGLPVVNLLAVGHQLTPVPVQPMKAIGAIAATQAAQSAVITANTVYAASLVTGYIWLIPGVTGVASHGSRKHIEPLVHRRA